MKLKLLITAIIISSTFFNAFAEIPPSVWEAFEKNDFSKARTELNDALKNDKTKIDAAITLMLLNNLESGEDNQPLMESIFEEIDNPSPYIYTMWFNDAVTNGYGKKEKSRLNFINKILQDERIHPSLKAAMHYVLGLHFTLSNKAQEAFNEWEQVDYIKDWQYTGIFDNTSGSGFDKNYGPLENSNADASFLSKTNSNVYWFTPQYPQKDVWMSTYYHVPGSQGVVYAQTFVDSPEDIEPYLSIGCSGSIKVWVNDELIISEEEERITELDLYKSKCKLNKGYNRVLVQLSYTQETSYPNFIVRFLDNNEGSIANLSSSSNLQTYNKSSAQKETEKKEHFAKTFFQKKIKEEPKNIVNHIMLSKYYYRNYMYNEAVEVLQKIAVNHPNNLLIQYEILLNYMKLKNRTEILEQVEKIRNINEENLFFYIYDFETNFDAERYEKAEENLSAIENVIGNKDEQFYEYKMKMLIAKKEYQELFELIDKAYRAYPTNKMFLKLHFSMQKEINKTKRPPIYIYENYLKDNYSYEIVNLLADQYKQIGKGSKAEKLYLQQHQMYPESSDIMVSLVNYYYTSKQYESALTYINKAIGNAPFNASHYLDRSYIYQALNKKDEAIEDLKTAIHHNPNLFEARERLRILEGKKEILSYFRKDNVETLIEEHLEREETSEDNYIYLFDESNYAIFPEGAYMQYNNVCFKILNKSGLEKWEDAYIPINEYSERLVIEDAQIYKPSGQKIPAEKYYNQLVFPSLEIGDIIHIEYRIDNYTGGKLSKEFWLTHCFNDFLESEKNTLRILASEGMEFETHEVNLDTNCTKKNIDEFVMYEWEYNNINKCETEPYMPSIYEIGNVLHISTTKSWKTISEWYRDIALPLAKSDYNVKKVFNELFPNDSFKTMSNKEKAEKIYSYICENINYSSISFRQSGLVPQKPTLTISTQLGDCKDMGTLFYTLAEMAELKTNLILVNTRDNGEERVKLPSIEFNHVIVKVDIEGKPYYLELTDNKMPFGAMPDNIINAQALIIPNNDEANIGHELINLPNTSFIANKTERTIEYTINDEDVEIFTQLDVSGNLSSDYRHYFKGLTDKETKDNMNYLYSDWIDNKFEVLDYSLENLDTLSTQFGLTTKVLVKNEIKSIGNLKVLKPMFLEKIFGANGFQEKERKHPLLYWEYENTDDYQTTITINLPQNSKISEIPENIDIKSKFINYSINIKQLTGNKVQITRTAKINRSKIEPLDYKEFISTIDKIIKAEDIYIAYKKI